MVDEVLQREVRPEALAQRVAPLLDRNDPITLTQRKGLRLVRERLGGGGAARRVAAIAEELLG